MAEQKTPKLEREYTIPLRRFWVNVPHYERTGNAIKTIKKFIAKHMKVADRDIKNVKLDVHFNNELWFRGRASPPAKVKVKAVKEGDIVKVDFIEVPQYVKFNKAKLEKRHAAAEKEAKPSKPAKEEKKEEKTEEQKKDESEKGKAVAEQNTQVAEQQAKTQKHLTKAKEESYHRMALKK